MKVNTMSVDDVEWIMFEHWPDILDFFKLQPKIYTCSVQFPLAPDYKTLKITLGNVLMTQFLVDSNIATMGCTL